VQEQHTNPNRMPGTRSTRWSNDSDHRNDASASSSRQHGVSAETNGSTRTTTRGSDHDYDKSYSTHGHRPGTPRPGSKPDREACFKKPTTRARRSGIRKVPYTATSFLHSSSSQRREKKNKHQLAWPSESDDRDTHRSSLGSSYSCSAATSKCRGRTCRQLKGTKTQQEWKLLNSLNSRTVTIQREQRALKKKCEDFFNKPVQKEEVASKPKEAVSSDLEDTLSVLSDISAYTPSTSTPLYSPVIDLLADDD